MIVDGAHLGKRSKSNILLDSRTRNATSKPGLPFSPCHATNAWRGSGIGARPLFRPRRADAATTKSLVKGFVDKRNGGRTANPVWDAIEQARYEGFALVGTFGRKSAKRQAERGDRTLKEAADELGVSVKGLRPFIKELNLLPEAKWNGDAHSIDQGTFTMLKDLIDDLITLPETTAITGIPGWEFRRVVKAGYVREFSGLRRSGVGGPKYLSKEVKAVVQRLRTITEVKPVKGMKTLLGYARQNGLSQGETLAMILSGGLQPSAFDCSRTGFRALYFTSSPTSD